MLMDINLSNINNNDTKKCDHLYIENNENDIDKEHFEHNSDSDSLCSETYTGAYCHSNDLENDECYLENEEDDSISKLIYMKQEENMIIKETTHFDCYDDECGMMRSDSMYIEVDDHYCMTRSESIYFEPDHKINIHNQNQNASSCINNLLNHLDFMLNSNLRQSDNHIEKYPYKNNRNEKYGVREPTEIFFEENLPPKKIDYELSHQYPKIDYSRNNSDELEDHINDPPQRETTQTPKNQIDFSG
jgi:hypothetical protein